MKYSVFAILAMLLTIGCKKFNINPEKNNKITSYIQITCENCQVGYGMPDQYKAFDNSGGLSSKFPYTYKEGYNLQVQIIPVGKSQNLSLQVYDTSGQIVYNGSVKQDASTPWGVSVLLAQQR